MDSQRSGWLNRTVLGAGFTSFLADLGYESACAMLPSFLLLLNLSRETASLALGIVEAAAELVSNVAKIGVGWYSDRIGRRKEVVVFGYALTGSAFALCAMATGWPLIVLAKSLGWLGKGIRGPLRNAVLTDATTPEDRGKAFGLHRAGDTLGAVLGPVVSWGCLFLIPADYFGPEPGDPHRTLFLWTLIPGLGSALAFALLVKEKRLTPKPGLRLGASLKSLPGSYRRYLVGVFLFGLGDFAPSLLILVATLDLRESLDPRTAAQWGILLFAWRNLVQVIASFPVGKLGDQVGKMGVLVFGYGLAAAAYAGCMALHLDGARWGVIEWGVFLIPIGLYMAIQESLEPAIVPDFVPNREVHGTAFGVLAAVNGLADVFACLLVATLFATFSTAAGLGFAAIMTAIGTIWMHVTRDDLQVIK